MDAHEKVAVKAEVSIEFGSRYRILLTKARQLHEQGHPEAAIVIAHTACEVCTELAIETALRANKVGRLTDPIDALLTGYNLANEKVRNLYVALTDDHIQHAPFWSAFKEHSKRRNDVVHRGRKATATEAAESISAVEAVIRHLTQATP